MSSSGEWDPVKGAVWFGVLLFSIAFWAGVFLLVDWMI